MLTPASVAISSRRRPGVRRERVPGGRPASSGRTPSRLARRKRPSSVGACSVIRPLCLANQEIGGQWYTPDNRSPASDTPETAGLPTADAKRQARQHDGNTFQTLYTER